MEQIEIILDAEGIKDQLEELTQKYELKTDYDAEAGFDGEFICSIVGTAANIAMFLLQVYALWGNKRIGFKSRDFEANEMTIEKVMEYLKSQQNKEE